MMSTDTKPLDGCAVLVIDPDGPYLDRLAAALRGAGARVYSATELRDAARILLYNPVPIDAMVGDASLSKVDAVSTPQR